MYMYMQLLRPWQSFKYLLSSAAFAFWPNSWGHVILRIQTKLGFMCSTNGGWGLPFRGPGNNCPRGIYTVVPCFLKLTNARSEAKLIAGLQHEAHQVLVKTRSVRQSCLRPCAAARRPADCRNPEKIPRGQKATERTARIDLGLHSPACLASPAFLNSLMHLASFLRLYESLKS